MAYHVGNSLCLCVCVCLQAVLLACVCKFVVGGLGNARKGKLNIWPRPSSVLFFFIFLDVCTMCKCTGQHDAPR